MCEGRFYLPYLQQQLDQMGVKLVHRRIASLEVSGVLAGTLALHSCSMSGQPGDGLTLQELAEYDVIVNCLGLGARKVVPDPSMTPIRGHVIRVRAPWVKAAYFEDEAVYVLPNRCCVPTCCLLCCGPFPHIPLLFRDNVVLGGTGQVRASKLVDSSGCNIHDTDCGRPVTSHWSHASQTAITSGLGRAVWCPAWPR